MQAIPPGRRQGSRNRHSGVFRKWEEGMKSISKMTLGLATALMASTAISNVAQAEDLTLCWAAWDPANALVELSKDFTAETGIGMKFEFVPWTNYADRFLNELNSKGKLCDLIIGDSAVDRRLGRERPLRQAQRFLRQGRDQDERLRRRDRRRLFGMAEEHAELLVAAGLWRRGRLDLSQGLVRQAGNSGGVQGKIRPRSGRARDLCRVEGHRRVLPEARDRRQDRLWRVDLHRARLRRRHHGRHGRALLLRLQVRESGQALRDGRLRQLRQVGRRPRILQVALRLLHASRRVQQLHGRGHRRLQIRPGGDAHELRLHLARPAEGRGGRRRQGRLLRQPGGSRRREVRPARRPGHLGGRPIPTSRTPRCNTSSGSQPPTCRRSGGRSAASPA